MPRIALHARHSSRPTGAGDDPDGRCLDPDDESAPAWQGRRVDLLGENALPDDDGDGASWFSALFGG